MDSVPRKDGGSNGAVVQPTNYQVRLISRQEVAERALALYFDRPTDFEFKAGQFIDSTLFDPPATASKENTRAFTIASASREDHTMSVTRLRNTVF